MKLNFLDKESLIYINENIEKQSKENTEIKYIRIISETEWKNNITYINRQNKLNNLIECAKNFYFRNNNIILTATYYLKNIIILQSFEDANHRTAITGTTIFLQSNGYNIKKLKRKCSNDFKISMLMYRNKEYYTIKPLFSDVLKFEDNNIENNEVFEYCYKFIKNKIVK